MKILYLSRALFPSEISHSLSIMRVCQAFADKGHETVLTGVTPGPNPTDAIRYYGLRGGFKVILNTICPWRKSRLFLRLFLTSGFILAWKTRGLFKSFRPHLVYSRLTIAELALVPRHLPILYEMHSLGPLGRFGIQKAVFRFMVRWKNFRRIIVTTDALAEMLRKELPGIEITVARLSAEMPIQVGKKALNAFKAAHLQGREFKYHIGYTGYLDTVGVRGTEIICQVASRIPESAFHIVGGEPQIVDHWIQYAKDYNHHSNLFFYGYRNPSDMPMFLGCFDVVMAPLQFRPIARAPIGQNMSPLKLPQYMSYGKAIVASDIPSHREILAHGETALLVPCDDVEAWVEAIHNLLEDPEQHHVLGSNALARYNDGFTPAGRIRKILKGINDEHYNH